MTTPLTSPASRALLLDFFTKALSTFQESQDVFRIICSLPTSTPSPSAATIPEPRRRKPTRPVDRLLVLDSSFNPPTLAHMGMAESAAEAYNSSPSSTRVLLLLSVKNADKGVRPASFPQRLAMMYIFGTELLGRKEEVEVVDVGLSTLPYFSQKCEAISQDPFYSVPGGPAATSMEQVYLAGYDTLIRIFNPKYYQADNSDGKAMQRALGPFFEKAKLRITARRGEWGGDGEQRAYLDGLAGGRLEEVGGRREWVGRVELVEATKDGRAVSSTAVRRAVGKGDLEGLRGLLSDGVREWVVEEGLYREGE